MGVVVLEIKPFFSSYAKYFAQEELQTNLKVCSFFVRILSKLSQKSAKVLMFRSRKKMEVNI